jgi:hypothetical protein
MFPTIHAVLWLDLFFLPGQRSKEKGIEYKCDKNAYLLRDKFHEESFIHNFTVIYNQIQQLRFENKWTARFDDW